MIRILLVEISIFSLPNESKAHTFRISSKSCDQVALPLIGHPDGIPPPQLL